jgi:hypothetical protein
MHKNFLDKSLAFVAKSSIHYAAKFAIAQKAYTPLKKYL